MTTITLNIEDTSVLNELKLFLNKMKIKFEENDVSYSSDFMKKLEIARKEKSQGKLKKVNPNNIWECIQ
jgi:hypothetical protein